MAFVSYERARELGQRPPHGNGTTLEEQQGSAMGPRTRKSSGVPDSSLDNFIPVEEQQVIAAGAEHDPYREPSEDKNASVILVEAKKGTGREDTRPDDERDVRRSPVKELYATPKKNRTLFSIFFLSNAMADKRKRKLETKTNRHTNEY